MSLNYTEIRSSTKSANVSQRTSSSTAKSKQGAVKNRLPQPFFEERACALFKSADPKPVLARFFVGIWIMLIRILIRTSKCSIGCNIIHNFVLLLFMDHKTTCHFDPSRS